MVYVMCKFAGNYFTAYTNDENIYYNDTWYALEASVTKISVRVRACHSARLSLAQTLHDQSSNAYEVVIGGYDNTLSLIRKQVGGDIEASSETPGILSCDRMREFYISWEDGIVSLSSDKDLAHSLVAWHDDNPHSVHFLSVSTGWGATGEWEIPHTYGNPLYYKQ